MSEYVIMPKDHWVAALDKVREKAGTTEPIFSDGLAMYIENLDGSSGDDLAVRLVERTLANVEIPEGATSVGNYAFYKYSVLDSVVIPNGVTEIGLYAFSESSALKSVDGCEGVTTINTGAFKKSGVTSVSFPSATRLSVECFAECTSLISADLPSVTELGRASSNSYGSKAFYNCTALKNVNIPLVTAVGHYSFLGCTSLEYIALPSIQTLTYSAFNGCSNLKVVNFSGVTSIPTLGNSTVFANVPDTCKLVIPDALYDEWIAATNWSALTLTYVKASEYVAEEAEA